MFYKYHTELRLNLLTTNRYIILETKSNYSKCERQNENIVHILYRRKQRTTIRNRLLKTITRVGVNYTRIRHEKNNTFYTNNIGTVIYFVLNIIRLQVLIKIAYDNTVTTR